MVSPCFHERGLWRLCEKGNIAPSVKEDRTFRRYCLHLAEIVVFSVTTENTFFTAVKKWVTAKVNLKTSVSLQ
jgi:hypothetical protein